MIKVFVAYFLSMTPPTKVEKGVFARRYDEAISVV